jgi:hypothetical protein
MDKDGYPEESELSKIREWDPIDFKGLMEYVQSLWHWPDYIKHEGKIYELHTGGWSGNESIIQAIESNAMLMLLYWVQSRRGGHYIFEDRELK